MSDSCNQCWIESPVVLRENLSVWIEKLRANQERRLDDLFVLQRWLATKSATTNLHFPCEIELSEKPDFILHMKGGSIGLEVTRFLAEQRARATKIANQEKIGYSPTLFDFDSPKRNNTEIKGLVRNHNLGLETWRCSQDIVNLYCEKLHNIIKEKTKKVIKEGAQHFPNNWLVIEDQHFISEHNLFLIKELIETQLENYWKKQLSFNLIFFVSLTEKCQGIVLSPPPTTIKPF